MTDTFSWDSHVTKNFDIQGLDLRPESTSHGSFHWISDLTKAVLRSSMTLDQGT